MNEPREVGNLEIVPGLDGSSYVLRAGKEIARFTTVVQAEAFVLMALGLEAKERDRKQDLGRSLEQEIQWGGDVE